MMNAEQFKKEFKQCHDAGALKRVVGVDICTVRGTFEEVLGAVVYAEDRLIEASLGGLDGQFIPTMSHG